MNMQTKMEELPSNFNGYSSSLEHLITAGAEVNMQDKDGKTTD